MAERGGGRLKKTLEKRIDNNAGSNPALTTNNINDMATQLMQSDIMHERVSYIIDLIKDSDLDGETMEYIIERVDMTDQMLRQLVLKSDPEVLLDLIKEKRDALLA